MHSVAHFLLQLVNLLFALYAAALAVTGAMAALGTQLGSFLYRFLAAYGTLCVCALYGVGASLALRLVGRHRISQWATARAFDHSMRLTCGVRFRIVAGAGHLRARPVVFVGNHQTALDILMLGATFPPYCSVTAKKSLRHMPFLGWFMALSGTVFIDRGNRQTAMRAFEGAAAEIRQQRQSVFIFPEGTRSNSDQPMLLPFKKGAFHLAIQAKVPVVPVVTACYAGVFRMRHRRFRAGEIPIVGLFIPVPNGKMNVDGGATQSFHRSPLTTLTRPMSTDYVQKHVIACCAPCRPSRSPPPGSGLSKRHFPRCRPKLRRLSKRLWQCDSRVIWSKRWGLRPETRRLEDEGHGHRYARPLFGLVWAQRSQKFPRGRGNQCKDCVVERKSWWTEQIEVRELLY